MDDFSQPIHGIKHVDLLESGLPLLPIRDIVVLPYMVLPLLVGRKSSIKALDQTVETGKMMVVSAQINGQEENPEPSGIHSIGCLVQVLRNVSLPEEGMRVIVQGIARVRITKYIQNTPFYMVQGQLHNDPPEKNEETVQREAFVRNIREDLQKLVAMGRLISPDILVISENVDTPPGKLADTVLASLSLEVADSQEVLEMRESSMRLAKVAQLLHREMELMTMQHQIQSEAKEEMTKTQREYFLREQLRAIQKELGEADEKAEEISGFKNKIEGLGMPPSVKEETLKQLGRLGKMHPEAPEAAMVRTYLEWQTELPWSKSTKDTIDLKKARKVLDEDHYDLEMVKERILEFLGVRKLKGRVKGPVLCFVGPPGVGKSSLGKSIARAMGRKFVHISLGGVHDEAEIRGHRRTYVGSMPGRIIQGLRRAGSNNPVFMLDEVDKLGYDFRGDPSAALLEVLDPEQNFSFSDHYLGTPFDLSNVMFIATANNTVSIPSALKDRMEVIDLPGYTADVKLKITRQFLLEKKMEEHGITEHHVNISDRAIMLAIEQYTREAGLRNIEREIAGICRKVARRIAEGDEKCHRVTAANLSHYLGVRKFIPESEQEEDEVGVATGLVWTYAGGDVMYVETALMKGKSKLSITGQLDDVMKESAQAALSYIRSRAVQLDLKAGFFSKQDIHVHLPGGSIPKDGPSAGVTIAASIASAFTGLPVSKDVAMTGEITLSGKVLAVEGLKEKLLAAKRVGIKKIILPAENSKDLSEIPRSVLRDLELTQVEEMDQVLENILVRKVEKVPSVIPEKKVKHRTVSPPAQGYR